MDIIDAANATVHDYLGGSESLGPRVGLPGAVLRSKVNPRDGTQQLTISEADRIMELTGDFRMLKALAHQHGFLLVESPGLYDSMPEAEALERRLGSSVANGEFKSRTHAAPADHRIDEKERQATHAAERALQAVATRLARGAETMTK